MLGGHFMRIQGWMLRGLMVAVAVFLIAFLVPETYATDGTVTSGFSVTVWGGIIGAIFIGLINAVIRPFITMLRVPATLVNLAVACLIINAATMYLTVVTIKGFEVTGLGWSVLSVLILSAISLLISYYISDDEISLG